VGDLAAHDFTAFYVAGDQLLAACGTQRKELGAFMELLRLGRLPATGELHGLRQGGLSQLLGK
jgi:hypothetical protein